MRRDHVASTLIRRHFDVVCLLGMSLLSTDSTCDFDNAVCRARSQGTYLRRAYSGQCINMTTPCAVVLQHKCPSTYLHSLYVCGTDGRTYSKLNFVSNFSGSNVFGTWKFVRQVGCSSH